MTEKTRKTRPIRCIVTSDSMDKSRVGTVERLVKHARYNKYIRRRTKVTFHDAENKTHVGDEVLVMACRPISKRKRFMLQEVLRTSEI